MSKQYLYRVDILNRKKSHPLESICYYSGEGQYDIMAGKPYTSNTTDKVLWNNILVPKKEDLPDLFKNLPDYLKFRSQKKDIVSNSRNILWQNVYARETREDAQFARLFEISIPSFLNQEDAIKALEKFAYNLIKVGIIADCSIHSTEAKTNISLLDKIKNLGMNNLDDEINKQESNNDYRGFLMCTLRDYEAGMFVNKNREWNSKKQMEDWRRNWVEILVELVETSHLSIEQKKEWDQKLSIYSEYDSIKKMYLLMNNKSLESSLTNNESQNKKPTF